MRTGVAYNDCPLKLDFIFFIMKLYKLSKFLKYSLMIFIIKGFRTIVFMFIGISTTFQLTSSGLLQVFVELWNFELCPLLNPWKSSVLIPLAITRYEC